MAVGKTLLSTNNLLQKMSPVITWTKIYIEARSTNNINNGKKFFAATTFESLSHLILESKKYLGLYEFSFSR